MIGYRQRDSLRLSKLGEIAGRVTIPAIHNIALMTGESNVCQLRGIQFGPITRLAACFASFQILRRGRGLSQRQDRP
jgi:hypothetical protein